MPEPPARFSGPGLVDLQVNGYAGFDFNSAPEGWSASDFRRVGEAMGRRGVVAALPTLISAPCDRLVAAARGYARVLADAPELERTFPRLHVEGPFLSPDDGPRGAHAAGACTTPAAQPDFLERMREASGDRLGLLTLAPELPGALGLIAAATAARVCVAIGHTSASVEQIAAAVDAGARMSTHLGNGSHQMLPRLANYVQAQLAEDRLAASFIADGHHIPWYTLQNFLRAKGFSRAILVTDAVAAADAPPGRYPLGEREVEATAAGRVQLPGQPNLAGSALSLDRAILGVVRHCGVPFAAAWEMASSRPAALVGLAPPAAVTVEVLAGGFRRVADAGREGPSGPTGGPRG